MKKLLLGLVLFVFSSSLLSLALDDQGNPNDPTVNERANACYEDGSMAGKCNTDWEWEAGWYLIRFDYGLISREDFPTRFRHLLPALPQKETGNGGSGVTPAPPANCQYSGSGEYLNFGSGDYLPVGSPRYSDINCSVFLANTIRPQVYTTGGTAAADAICVAHGSTLNTVFMVPPVYFCF